MNFKILALTLSLSLPAAAVRAAEPTLKTDEQKTLYALGVVIARQLGQFSPTPADVKYITMGLADFISNKNLRIDLNLYGPKIQELQAARQKVKTDAAKTGADAEKKKAKAYLEKAAKEKGAQVFPSGLIFTEIRPGTGPSPAATDTVKAFYVGTFDDGVVFDSSYSRGNDPVAFSLSGVVACWTEGIPKMKVGGKARLVCPSDIGYGDAGRSGIKGGQTLVFEVELAEIVGAK